MKKTILIALIIVIGVMLILIAVGCVRPILPGTYVEIVYPASGAVVPTEFSVLTVAAKWSLGVEINTPLFLGTSESHVGLPPSVVELSIDGVPYGRSGGGNHHVFRIAATPGDHTLLLVTPYGNREITVTVTDAPPIAFSPFYGVDEYAASVDALTRALYDFRETEPVLPVSADTEDVEFQRIFLSGRGAFILLAAMKERFLSACEVRYIAPIGPGITAEDIGAAPVVLTWDTAGRPQPATLTAVENGGDRLYLVVVDEQALTVISVFPDGSSRSVDVSLASVAPDLPGAVASALFPEIRTKAYRDFLFIGLHTYGTAGPTGRFEILYSAGTAEMIDLGGFDVDGISPTGRMLLISPTPSVGPFETRLADGQSLTKICFPLPDMDDVFAFTGGSVHDTSDFYPEHPRFEIDPLVPCPGCTKDYVPAHYGVAGDVTFGPGILKTTLGGRVGYLIMGNGENE